MLPQPLRAVADRFITILMTLVRATAHAGLNRTETTHLPLDQAITFFARVNRLVIKLMYIYRNGVRPSPQRRAAQPNPARKPDPTPAAPRDAAPGSGLPRRPGWLLDALRDTAPAVAADLAALLADPATPALLAAAPQIARALRSILRSLDLPEPQPLPPPDPNNPPTDPPQNEPAPDSDPGAQSAPRGNEGGGTVPPHPTTTAESPHANPHPTHAQLVTLS